MHHISDELRFIGAPLTDEDLVMAVLNGLGPEYNPFVITVTMTNRLSPLSFAEIHGLLLSHENLLKDQNNQTSLSSINFPATAFVARPGPRPPYQGPKPNYYNPNSPTRYPAPRPGNNNQYRPSQNQPYFPGPRQNRPNSPNLSLNQPFPQTTDKPQCQICMKFGHTTKICYFRYNADRTNANSL